MTKKNLIIFAITIVALIVAIFAGRYFTAPMAGHPLVRFWTPVNEETQIGPMTTRDFTLLSFEDRGRGGVVCAEAPSAHDHRFIWSAIQRSENSGIIIFNAYPNDNPVFYPRPRRGDSTNFYYSYRIEENLLVLTPVDENWKAIGEEIAFRRR